MNAEAILDSQLVTRFNAGEESAFVEIMKRHQERIFASAMALVRNRSDAEEIAQDTFVRAHRALPRFRGDSSVATWLHKIAVNLARNRYWYHFRRRKHATLSLDATVGDDGDASFSELISTSAPDPSQETSRSEFVTAIETSLEKLEPWHRKILTMRSVLDLSYEDIAVTLGINVGTVKSRIARARERLRSQLAQECPEFTADGNPSEWFEPARGEGQVAAAS